MALHGHEGRGVSAALYYHPDAYSTQGAVLMGRHVAGESFLRGYFTHGSAPAWRALVDGPGPARDFARQAQAAGSQRPVQALLPADMGALAQAGTLHLPGPGLARAAWQRAAFGAAAWSLTGLTHTTSSAVAMDALADLVVAPVQPWDALICTSAAVKDNVERLLQAQVQHLRERLGATRAVLPRLPVIPLGVHAEDFVWSEAHRAQARRSLEVGSDAVVVLYMGRLSFHAKAHPLVMYQALQQAAQASGVPVVLVECGWHANDSIARAYAQAAAHACPDVRVVRLDGRQAAERRTAWAGADVFCSLADNIQESFGITPVEAMAAALPAVVSDWDGYRDTVRDGVDGFRIPTCMPPPGFGRDLALRHALEADNYDMYCGHVSQWVAVDVQAAARAFARLFASPALRRRMGQAGRQRARQCYGWAAIIGRYEALWSELGELRRAAQPGTFQVQAHAWPARLDPFHAFAAYPTQALHAQTRLGLARPMTDLGAALEQVAALRRLAMVDFAQAVLPGQAQVEHILGAALDAGSPVAAHGLVAGLARERQAEGFRALAWLLKLGMLKFCD